MSDLIAYPVLQESEGLTFQSKKMSEQSATSRKTSTAKKSSKRGCRKETSTPLPYGVIYVPSTENPTMDEFKDYMEASLARTSATQEKAEALLRRREADYGLRLLVSITLLILTIRLADFLIGFLKQFFLS